MELWLSREEFWTGVIGGGRYWNCLADHRLQEALSVLCRVMIVMNDYQVVALVRGNVF